MKPANKQEKSTGSEEIFFALQKGPFFLGFIEPLIWAHAGIGLI